MSRTKQVMEVFLTLISALLLVQDARGKLFSNFTVLVVYYGFFFKKKWNYVFGEKGVRPTAGRPPGATGAAVGSSARGESGCARRVARARSSAGRRSSSGATPPGGRGRQNRAIEGSAISAGSRVRIEKISFLYKFYGNSVIIMKVQIPGPRPTYKYGCGPRDNCTDEATWNLFFSNYLFFKIRESNSTVQGGGFDCECWSCAVDCCNDPSSADDTGAPKANFEKYTISFIKNARNISYKFIGRKVLLVPKPAYGFWWRDVRGLVQFWKEIKSGETIYFGNFSRSSHCKQFHWPKAIILVFLFFSTRD